MKYMQVTEYTKQLWYIKRRERAKSDRICGLQTIYLSIYLSIYSSDASLPPGTSPKGVAMAEKFPPLPVQTLPLCLMQPSPSDSTSHTCTPLLCPSISQVAFLYCLDPQSHTCTPLSCPSILLRKKCVNKHSIETKILMFFFLLSLPRPAPPGEKLHPSAPSSQLPEPLGVFLRRG